MESDDIPPPPDSTISFEITPEVTQVGDHVADEDADIDKDQGPVMGDVQNSNAVGRTRRNTRMPSWLTTNMIVVYALSVVEETISSTYIEKLKLIQSPRCGRMP